jgi:xylan 1,4-beta-xylosidase
LTPPTAPRTLVSRLLPIAFAALATAPASLIAQTPATTITVHAAQPAGRYLPNWNYFGADEPNYIYAANGEKLLRELHDLSPVPVYFRPHNLLTTGDGEASLKWGSTNAYREDAAGRPVYDWTITDRIFDALKAAGVRPLVEVGFMPEALSTHPEPYRHHFPEGSVYTGWSYPPTDYARWGALVEAYATHLKQRYGAGTDGWLWEVWNEPDIEYWHGTPEEYDRLYDVTTAAIRSVLPQARVGGPASTGVATDKAEAFLRQFLEHCDSGKNAAGGVGAPLDFISYHPKGSPRFVDGHVVMNVGRQLHSIERGMKIVASYPRWKTTPIILTETDPEGCAACKGPQNGYRNGPLYGVSVAEATARTYQLARKYGVTVQGGVTWAFEFEDQPYFAGFRELATNGVDKAVLNVFRMYGKLGGDWVKTESTGALPLEQIVTAGVTDQPDIDAVATRQPHEVDVLVWNYHDVDLPAAPANITIKLDGLPHGKTLHAHQYRMDATHSNAYAAWLTMGSPEKPTPSQQAALETAGALASIPTTLDAAGAVTIELPRQGVALLRIDWEDK